MSLFIGASSQYAQGVLDPEKIKMAVLQFNATAATFNMLLDTCGRKCIGHEYGESDLASGEASCVDRCATKYFKANVLVGNNFNEKNVDPLKYMEDYNYVQRRLSGANN